MPSISTTVETTSVNAGKAVQMAVYDKAGKQVPVGRWEIEMGGSAADASLADSTISSEGLMSIDEDANCRGVVAYAYINKGQYRGLRTQLYIVILYPNLVVSPSSSERLLPKGTMTMTAKGFSADEVEWEVDWDKEYFDPVPENPTFTWNEAEDKDGNAYITITHTCDADACECAYGATAHASLASNQYYNGISTLRFYNEEVADTVHLVWNDFAGIYRESTTENPSNEMTIDASKYDGFSFALGEGAADVMLWEIQAVDGGGEIGTTHAESGRLYLDKTAKPSKFKMIGKYDMDRFGSIFSEDTQIVFDITVTY